MNRVLLPERSKAGCVNFDQRLLNEMELYPGFGNDSPDMSNFHV